MTTFTISRGGQTYSGAWRVTSGLLHVSSAYGTKTAPVASADPGRLAITLLHDIVAKWAADVLGD